MKMLVWYAALLTIIGQLYLEEWQGGMEGCDRYWYASQIFGVGSKDCCSGGGGGGED